MVRLRALGWLGLVGLAASGCGAVMPVFANALTHPDRTVVSPAGVDGTRYLAVESGPLTSPGALRTRWKATARQVCEGDYMRLSDASLSRQQAGVTRTRIHEGYVRCLLPGEQGPSDAPSAPTMADAPPDSPANARAHAKRME